MRRNKTMRDNLDRLAVKAGVTGQCRTCIATNGTITMVGTLPKRGYGEHGGVDYVPRGEEPGPCPECGAMPLRVVFRGISKRVLGDDGGIEQEILGYERNSA